ncbi:MAG: phosphate regulon transcriptional regulatory protein PhoB [Xanthomonadaceae bacterium]|nr:phosphate regulon transcriptional regulatory protein PhoB [Xanthomonadaceae bacterium]
MSATILTVEDDDAVRQMLVMALRRGGYAVSEAENAAAARIAIYEQRPDLVLLDWMLPDMSGIELARALKRDPSTRDLPIIMLTARGEEADRVRGLEVGADDYVVKPFSPHELLARIKAVLRRTQPADAAEAIEIAGLRLDPLSHRVTAHGRELSLGPTEYRLLLFFMSQPDRVFSRGQLLDNVWGTNVYIEERTVDVHIRRLRKTLAETGHDRLIQTVRGAGYRFSAR